MITCPACNQKEFPGAIFCSKCGKLLIYPEDTTTSVIERTNDYSGQSVSPPSFPTPPADAVDSQVALLILKSGVVIHIQGKDEYKLGRSTKGQTILPDIDLNPYNAYEAGVSRLHANIRVSGSKAWILDLGSANGTRLNGKQIEAHFEHPIQHGDIFTFGQLEIQVLIKEK